jgi:hypothetical protein
VANLAGGEPTLNKTVSFAKKKKKRERE